MDEDLTLPCSGLILAHALRLGMVYKITVAEMVADTVARKGVKDVEMMVDLRRRGTAGDHTVPGTRWFRPRRSPFSC